jgi:hypothetical protein
MPVKPAPCNNHAGFTTTLFLQKNFRADDWPWLSDNRANNFRKPQIASDELYARRNRAGFSGSAGHQPRSQSPARRAAHLHNSFKATAHI